VFIRMLGEKKMNRPVLGLIQTKSAKSRGDILRYLENHPRSKDTLDGYIYSPPKLGG
jgi:hypothetical protein